MVIPSQAVEGLENASSYKAATAAFRRFQTIAEDDLTDELLDRIEKACKKNGQLDAQWKWGSTTVADEAMKIV